MKERGIKNRCRIYDIPKNVKYIIAKPEMKEELGNGLGFVVSRGIPVCVKFVEEYR